MERRRGRFTGDLARPQEGCLDRTREPLPTRFDALPELPAEYWRVLAAASISWASSSIRRLRGHRRPRPAPGRLDLLDQSHRDPRARGDRARARPRQPDGAAGPPRHGIDRFVDIGSGGGFPGLPLALTLPARRAFLVESTGKKARFLETAIGAIGAADTIGVAAVRAESLGANPAHRAEWPCVTARAVASLSRLVELAFPLLASAGCSWPGSASGSMTRSPRRRP